MTNRRESLQDKLAKLQAEVQEEQQREAAEKAMAETEERFTEAVRQFIRELESTIEAVLPERMGLWAYRDSEGNLQVRVLPALAAAFKRVVPFRYMKGDRDNISHVWVEADGGFLTLIASEGYRMARATLEADWPNGQWLLDGESCRLVVASHQYGEAPVFVAPCHSRRVLASAPGGEVKVLDWVEEFLKSVRKGEVTAAFQMAAGGLTIAWDPQPPATTVAFDGPNSPGYSEGS
jgi:hypothetical protein